MELDYFIAQSSRASSSQKDTWLNSASLVTGNFTQIKSAILTGISGNANFSLFVTLDRKKATQGNLLSNYTTTGGFAIGFTRNNEIFVYSQVPEPNCFYFPEVRLSKKNCLGIIKSDSRITVLNYDLNSRTIYQSASKSFDRTTNLDGGKFSIGYDSTLHGRTQISGVSGLFDQLACFNRAFDENDALTIFSGFLDINDSSVTSYSKYYQEDSLSLNSESAFTEEDVSGFKPFLNYLTTGIVPVGTGNYIASISGTGDYTLFRVVWSGYHKSGDGIVCYSDEPETPVGGILVTGYLDPITSDNIIFQDQIYASMNAQSERLVSHMVSFYPFSSPTQLDFFSYNVLEKYRTETITTFSENTGGSYKSGFYRDGVVVKEKFCNLMRYPDKTHEDVEHSLPFDVSNQRFLTTEDFTLGYNLYWANEKISSYSISGDYIETNQVEESNNYKMIFDKATRDPMFVHANYGYATGVFPMGAAVVLAGETLIRSSYRLTYNNFWETSTMHQIHGQKDNVVLPDLESIYPNSELHWSDTMDPYSEPAIP